MDESRPERMLPPVARLARMVLKGLARHKSDLCETAPPPAITCISSRVTCRRPEHVYLEQRLGTRILMGD